MHLQSQTAQTLTSNQADKPFRTESTGPTEEGKEKKPPTRETKKECSEVRRRTRRICCYRAKEQYTQGQSGHHYHREKWFSKCGPQVEALAPPGNFRNARCRVTESQSL